MLDDDTYGDLIEAIAADNLTNVRGILTKFPGEINDLRLECRWLHKVVEKGSIGMIEMLLAMGFDINGVCEPEDETPLMAAVFAERVDVVSYLLSQGAEAQLSRPIISAICIDDEEVALQIVQLLVNAGADVNARYPWYGRDDMSETALSFATQREQSNIVRFLVSRGANASR